MNPAGIFRNVDAYPTYEDTAALGYHISNTVGSRSFVAFGTWNGQPVYMLRALPWTSFIPDRYRSYVARLHSHHCPTLGSLYTN